MFSAMLVTRNLLQIFRPAWLEKYLWLIGGKKQKA
jgi:hypothetical protein